VLIIEINKNKYLTQEEKEFFENKISNYKE